MVAYEDEEVIDAPRPVVWKLLADHLNDTKIVDIHPLIQSQKTVERSADSVVVDRIIDVNRKMKKSRWKISYHAPDHARWEVLESEGPWAPGSYLELTYSEEGRTTRVHCRGELAILDLPFFLSQPRMVRRMMGDIHTEDVFFLRRYHY